MRFQPLPLLLAALTLLAVACNPPGASAAEADPTGPSQITSAISGLSDCPVTQHPQPSFIPPSPWPAQPPGHPYEFWLGDDGLWTVLPISGSWGQLALGEKFWWWSEEFDVSVDPYPDLIVTARRLDKDTATFQTLGATNGYHESFKWAMLMGVKLPSPGCWEFTGQYKAHQLSFVLWVPQE